MPLQTMPSLIPYPEGRPTDYFNARSGNRIGGERIHSCISPKETESCYRSESFYFTFAGKGTPAPIDPPKELVERGLYRFSRNPMYVGVLFILFGEAIFFATLLILGYMLVFFFCFHLFVVAYEEPTLRRTFGAAYKKYCDAVPRWFPRFDMWPKLS